ncbi:MAG: sigma-70 family RNA polymerase sigma factor [Candidatus Auribacterota bacterium]|jgi:RNA polymerase sigma-70 factor (ECF subfamily)|uniref:RNA polymerase sigma factor n=1 Tax=Candidatus Auribacter fodinae TaxID=2093366 RepID=A0A3A4RDQ7_9BACT|nr:MAG: sigma-70 family RNA polymerase sigma factor [Candidatus Auribacter fodinae]
MGLLKDEAKLIKECQKGSVDSFDVLVKRYKERVYSLAYQMIGDHSSADDVTQEVFIRAFRGLPKFQGKCSFFTWLYRITINCSYRYLRKNMTFLKKVANDIDPAVYMDDQVKTRFSSNSPYKNLEMKETMDHLSRSIDKLPLKHKTALIMFEFQGLSIQDISDIMKTSPGTVKSRLHHARLKIRASMEDSLNSDKTKPYLKVHTK